MNGADVLLKVNTGTPETPVWTAVGSQRDSSFDETTEEVDVSSKDQRAKRVVAGRYGSTFSLDALYVPTGTAFQALKTAKRNGDLIQVCVSEEGEDVEYAYALITSMSRSYPDQDGATISISGTVDGEWTALP